MAKTRRERKERRENRYSSAKERAENRGTGFERTTLSVKDATFFTLDKAGQKRIDVLPYEVGKGNPYAEPDQLHYERTYWVHRGVGPNNDSYTCPAKTVNKPCPICEYRAKLQRDPDSDEDLIKDLAPKERQLWNVIDLTDPDAGVQLWDISFHLFGKLLDAEIRNSDEDEQYENFFHLEDGLTLKLGVKQKSWAGNTFYEVETIGFKARKESYGDEMLERVYKLDDCIAILDYDKLRAIFLQTDEEDGDVDEPPPKKKSKEKTTKTSKPHATADDAGIEEGSEVEHKEFGTCEVVRVSGDGTSLTLEGEDDNTHKAVGVDEVTLVEEKPKPKKGKVKMPPKDEGEDDDDDDDDDWDDDDDEEEEEEEKPKPKKTGKKTSAKPKPKSKPVEEEDEEDDEDDWDDDEEKEKPKPKKGKSKSKPKPKKEEEEEEDDDDDWDDDDE